MKQKTGVILAGQGSGNAIKSFYFKCAILASVSASSLPSLAMAQTAAKADNSDVLDEIVVTAFRRSESVLKIPAAITAISGDDLKTKGVNNVTDLQNLVPGVSIATSQDGVTVGIRGVRTTDTSSKGEQDISFNIDGVYVGRGNARGTAFFDLDRVEILRGPQGTLYGRSSTGGAINLITKRPQLGVVEGYLKTEFGNYNAKRTEGAFNIPLGDVFAFRFAGAFNDRDGYSRPVGYNMTSGATTYYVSAANADTRNDQNDRTGRASLYFQPNDNLSARVTATAGNQRGNGSATLVESFLTGSSGSHKFDILANPLPAFVDNSFLNFDGNMNVKFGNMQLDVLGSHQHFELHQQQSYTFNAEANSGGQFGLTLQNSEFNTTQFETRLSNVETSVVDYVIGANYYNESIDENGHLFNSTVPDAGVPDNWSSFFQVKNHTPHKAYGFFAQGTWHVTDALGVVAGARYTHDEVERTGYLALPAAFGGCQVTYPNDCDGQGIPNQGSATDNKTTWHLGLNYQLNPNHLIYASASTGFKGGGFNDYDPSSTNSSGTKAYPPSSITAYEVGYKGRPLDKLVLSSALFYYDFSGNQQTGQVFFPATGQNIIYTATVPSEIYGLENELSYNLAAKTTLSGTVAYQYSRYASFLAGSTFGSQVSWAGLPLDQTPKLVATVGLDHAVALRNGAELRFRGQFKYSDGYELSDFANAVRYTQPSFTRSDLSVTYAATNDAYTLQLFVENLENKVQRTGVVNNYSGPFNGNGTNRIVTEQPFGYLNFSTTTPRFYGVRLGVKF